MNNPQRPTDAGCVEQCDRDAAADYYLATKSRRTDEHISRLVRQGDHAHALVAAFAAHRLAALSASGGDAAELAAADMSVVVARDAANSYHMTHMIIVGGECVAFSNDEWADRIAAAIRALPLAKQEQS